MGARQQISRARRPRGRTEGCRRGTPRAREPRNNWQGTPEALTAVRHYCCRASRIPGSRKMRAQTHDETIRSIRRHDDHAFFELQYHGAPRFGAESAIATEPFIPEETREGEQAAVAEEPHRSAERLRITRHGHQIAQRYARVPERPAHFEGT